MFVEGSRSAFKNVLITTKFGKASIDVLHLTTGKNPWDQCYFDSEFGDHCQGVAMQTSFPTSRKVCERCERWVKKCAFPGDLHSKASRKDDFWQQFHESEEEPCSNVQQNVLMFNRKQKGRTGIRQFCLRDVERVPPPQIASESNINYFR